MNTVYLVNIRNEDGIKYADFHRRSDIHPRAYEIHSISRMQRIARAVENRWESVAVPPGIFLQMWVQVIRRRQEDL